MEKKGSNNKKTLVTLIILLVISLVGGGLWYREYVKYITTDDALLDGDFVALAPKMPGRIVNISVNEGDSVKTGTLLVEMDSTDLCAQKKQALAQVNQAVANLAQAQTRYNADKINLNVYQINTDKANSDLNRATRQREADVITEEQFENIKKNAQTSQAQLETAKAQVKISEAQVNAAHASIENAEALVSVLQTQMQNMRLYSPFNGLIARKWLIPGDMVQAGQSVLTINNAKNIWVSVYIEETKLKDLHIGQDAEFKIDAVPDQVFTGKIFYIGNNTASKFSLIPPSNASGNFTKITQRVQLKVSIDNIDANKAGFSKIFPGMSVVMKLLK